MTALGLRIGGDTVGPGEARALAVPLPDRRGDAGADDTVPALVIAGHRPGPRVAVLAGARGFEVSAARTASALEDWLPPAQVNGTIVIVPVLRPGGRFAAAGRPVSPALVWRFPGDPAGARAARDAYAAFAALVGDAALVLTISEADPGRVAAPTIRGELEDPRARRLMRASGAAALLPARRRRPPVSGPGAPPETVHLEVMVPSNGPLGPRGERDGGARGDAVDAGAVVRRLLHACGAWTPAVAPEPAPARPPVCRHTVALLAPAGGFVEVLAAPGAVVAKGGPLARITPPLARGPLTLTAPQAGIVLEAPTREGTRRGAKLFVLGKLARANGERGPAGAPVRAAAAPAPAAVVETSPVPPALCLGWVERVSLPDLGIELPAKIDTGARTSALHVTRMRTITGQRGLPDRPQRPLLEITIPRGGGKRPRGDRVVRVRVRDHAQIKDSSGRTERRPVIETTLRLGGATRRIRVTLTDRGDMLYPMLIGRTALGAGVVVDPSRRHLLDGRRREPRRDT